MPAASGWGRRPAAQRDREQGQRLRAWLSQEVVPFSAFWRQRLTGLGDDALQDVRRLPVTEEAELSGAGGPGNPALLMLPSEDDFKRSAGRRELWAAAREVGRAAAGGVASAEARRAVLFRRFKPIHVHAAGVAAPVAVAYTRSDLDRLHLAGARLAEVLGVGADDALVNAVPAGPTLAFWGLYHMALAAYVTALHPVAAGENPGPAVTAAVRRACAMLPPSVLAAPVDRTAGLLQALAADGVRLPHLRLVLTVGPPPPAAVRRELTALARDLGAAVRVQAVWAPATARALWGECRPPAGDPAEATYGLHTYPDLEVVELRDPATGASVVEAVPDGAINEAEQPGGELVYTSLGWRGTTLVRCATGTWVGGLTTTATCPACGRTVPRLAPAVAEGAWHPRVRHAGGGWLRIDLRRAARVLRPAALERHAVRDWSLRAVDGRLVLGADLHDGAPPPLELVREIGHAVGVTPELHLGREAAAARPQLGEAGPRS